jgi:hypothetical protein
MLVYSILFVSRVVTSTYISNADTYLTKTLAGNGIPGLVDGLSVNAEFNFPGDVALAADQNTLLIADDTNNALRKMDLATGQVTTLGSHFSLNTC